MFHLLKRTTMVPDFMARQACEDSVVISKWGDYAYVYPKDVLDAHIHCSQKYTTFEEWFETSFANDEDFIAWVYDTREMGVQIYADYTTYAKIVIKWLKFICPNLTDEQMYKIYKLSTLWYYVFQVNMQMNTRDEPLAPYESIIDNYKTVSYDEFVEYCKQITIIIDQQQLTEIKALIKNYISNEYKYAFFMNGDESFKSMVEEHVNKALVRCLKMELDQYKYVSLFDIMYDNYDRDIDQIDDQLFDIIKQASKTLPNDEVVEQSIDQLYNYGVSNDHQLLTHNNVFVDEYYQILSDDKTLTDKINFIASIAEDGVKKSEFVDCFSSSYMMYNLLLFRWIVTMYKQKDSGLKNFVY